MDNFKRNFQAVLVLSILFICSGKLFGQGNYTTFENSSGEWNKDWKFYKVFELKETNGLTRINEPVDVVLNFSPGKINSPENEIRVVEKDFRSGEFIEVPSQVYYLPGCEKELHVVFLANVVGNSEKEYRIYYGNPNASKPNYYSDLKVRGNAPQSIVENDFYIVDMSAGESGSALNRCGQVRTITPKPGFNVTFSRRDGYVHYTPDCSRMVKGERIGVKFMNPPTKCFEIKGPIMYLIHREGIFTEDEPFIKFTVIYKFYSSVPYIVSKTEIELLKTTELNSLRNDELTFNSKIFTHNAWKEFNEVITTKPFPIERIKEGNVVLETSLTWPLRIPANLPWITFFNAEKGYGIASIHLDYQKFGSGGEPGITQNERQEIRLGKRGNYWSRFIISGSPVSVPKGSKYTERNAYLVYKIDPEISQRFRPVEEYNTSLRNPLLIKK